jgi:AraC-like DNA-binding protein
MSRAVRWITEHYDKPFRVEDLARSCGMSTSAFHRNFHSVTAHSPIQFQKQIRLQKSRLLLLTGADDVATVGYRVGYDSTSQFSREGPTAVRASSRTRRGASPRWRRTCLTAVFALARGATPDLG